jgi:uncharacterized Tic20 family protein
MFHAPLTPQARHRAAICHWGGLLWLPIELGLFSVAIELYPEINRDLNLFFSTAFAMLAGALLLAGCLQMFCWKGWRAKHEFIDRSGREASNFGLSAALYLGLALLMVFAAFALADVLPFLVPVGVFGMYLIPATLFLHMMLAIAGGMVAWRGSYYIYPWTIRFFQ